MGLLVALILFLSSILSINCNPSLNFERKDPSILIVTLVRNKAHTLPYFLAYLHEQDYDKKRISIWIRSDHNEDYTSDVLHAWAPTAREMYQSVNVAIKEDPSSWSGEKSPFEWIDERLQHVINLKEEGLKYGRKILADYVFFLDADVFLTDRSTLKKLTGLKLPIVSPLLDTDSLYTNFWGGMQPNYYYKRSDDYLLIKNREKLGEFQVPLVNSAILIDMNTVNAKYLTHNKTILKSHRINSSQDYYGPSDDQIVLALSSYYAQLPMYISNSHKYGHLLPPMPVEAVLKDDLNQFVNLLLTFIHDQTSPVVPEYLDEYTLAAKKSTMGLSKIFVINLEQRKERLQRFSEMADIIGLNYTRFSAVDGKSLTLESLKVQGIRVVPEFEHQRPRGPIKVGEIGCFWSHYKVWQQIVEEQLDRVLILEDNIMFKRHFRFLAENVLKEARIFLKYYDIIHFGETGDPINMSENSTVNATNIGLRFLKEPGSIFSSRGYVITLDGAKKLLAAGPLQKLVPIDEFFAIMSDKHPDRQLKKYFPKRNIVAYAVQPSIVEDAYKPTDPLWASDTEISNVIEGIPLIYAEIPIVRDEL